MVQSSQKQIQLKTLNLSASGKLALRKSSKKISKKDKTAAAQCSKAQIIKPIDNKISAVSTLEQMLNCNNKIEKNQSSISLLQEISLPVIAKANSDYDRRPDTVLELGTVAPQRRFLFSSSQDIFENDNFACAKSTKMDE